MSIQLLDQTETARRITQLVVDAERVEQEIHLLACSTLDHVREHSNTTDVVRLMNGLPRGQRVKALAKWYKDFSSSKLILSLNDEKKWVAELKKDREDEDFRISEAVEITFAEYTPERAPNTVTVKALIRMLNQRATNTETNKDGSPQVSPEARALASKLVAYVRDNGEDKLVAMSA